MGVSLEDIRITAADTEITPLDPGTFGSGVTLRAGNAARMAARAAKEKLFEAVADQMETTVEKLDMDRRRIHIKVVLREDEPSRGPQSLSIFRPTAMPVIGRVSYHPPAKEPTTLLREDGNFSPAYSFMTQAAEVKVDTKTGKIRGAEDGDKSRLRQGHQSHAWSKGPA